MSFNVSEVENLNRTVQRLNADRQQKIGMQQAAQQSYDRAVQAYFQEFGVKVDDTNIQQEYNEVHQQLQNEFQNLSKMVSDIEAGVYNVQTQPTLVENTEEFQAQAQQTLTQPQHQVQPSYQQPTTQQPTFQQPTFQQPTIQQPNQSEQEQQTEHRTLTPEQAVHASMQAMTQQLPPVHVPPTPVSTQQQQTEQDVSEQAFTPQGWGVPDIDKTFEGINGGGFGK